MDSNHRHLRRDMRGSKEVGIGKGAICLISVWARESQLVLGLCQVDEISNEFTAIPEWLNLLVSHDCVVTIDAIGCQKETAAKSIEQKAEHVLAVTAAQGRLQENFAELLSADIPLLGQRPFRAPHHTINYARLKRLRYPNRRGFISGKNNTSRSIM